MIQHKKSYYRYIVIALLLVMPALGITVSGVGAQSTTDESAAANPAGAPKAVFPELTHDFGTILEGDKVQYDFIVENQGSAPLEISKVQPD